MGIFCCNFTLYIVEAFTFNRVLFLTVVGVVDASKQRPERRSSGFTDEPTGCVASELKNTRFKSS